MPSSAKELDLDPDVYIGLTYPIRKGIMTDFELTKTSYEQAEYNLTNLLLTQKGERVYQPEFGSNLRRICFEQVDDNLLETIETDIKNTVEQWLSYIIINEIEVLTDDGNTSKIYIQIKYSTIIESFRENTVLVAFDSIT
jgi:phage baseplate assembly protein W|tara:strand:- start:8 stop:427 length:420 start_codon:yes stop_codon:yes gene_type:complete